MLQGYCQFKGLPFSEVECLLDLVVVSIASDIVPLVGENRILAYYGLKRLNEKPGKGLSSIIKICGLDKHVITIDDIVFKIGPRINAAGRMEVDSDDENAAPSGGHSAVYLMVARDEDRHLQSGPQEHRPFDHTGSPRDHRKPAGTEKPQKHGDL